MLRPRSTWAARDRRPGLSKPRSIPAGKVLVIGSGQTGCQISEELHEAGREVFLACGRAPWAPRQPDGRDIVSWLRETTFFDLPVGALPSPATRLVANVQVTGARGGHDLHFRTLQTMGVLLLGRLTGVEGHRAFFADDLADSVAFGDARYADIKATLSDQLAARGTAVPELPDPPPFRADPPREFDLDGFGVVIRTTGFRPDYAHWVPFPAVVDSMGFRSPTMTSERWSLASSSAASTSCASASRRRCSAWVRTPPSWRNRSPATDQSWPQPTDHESLSPVLA